MSPQEIQPFDWYRLFLGEMSPLFTLEVVFRTIFMYLYTLSMARLIGKRGMSQLTPFEYIIVIVLGSASGDPMIYPDVPLIHGMAVVTSVVILHKILTEVTLRNEKLESWVESKPDLIIHKGKLLHDAISKSNLSKMEIDMQLRLKSIDNVGDVEYAFLEPSGQLSVFKYSKSPKLHRSTLPKKEIKTEKKRK